jgi:hypothetical protein
MNNRPVGGHSSETLSQPVDMNKKLDAKKVKIGTGGKSPCILGLSGGK